MGDFEHIDMMHRRAADRWNTRYEYAQGWWEDEPIDLLATWSEKWMDPKDLTPGQANIIRLASKLLTRGGTRAEANELRLEMATDLAHNYVGHFTVDEGGGE